MFSPEVEARFKRIEDANAVTAELLRRHELRSQERMGHFEGVLSAIARWMDRMADWQEEHEKWRNATDHNLDAMKEAVAELSRTVDRFLKSRMNGGGG
jgi:hypothetical protein